MQGSSMLNLLQVYRGFAALLVVLFHASAVSQLYFGTSPVLSKFAFGWSGVQFFFVLSGFIIYHVHGSEIGRALQLPRYARKRLIRIYPLYIAITLSLTPFWLWVPSFGESYHKEVSALAFSLLLIPQAHPPHLDVAWTLTHEMLFYAVFAVLIASKRLGSALVIIWVAAVAVAAAVGSRLAYPWSFFFSINNLLFGVGMLTAKAADYFPWKDSLWWLALWAAAFVVTGAVMVDTPSTPAILMFGFFSFALLLQSKSERLNKLAGRWPLLKLLGDASYAIYLVHVPALSLGCKLLGQVPALLAFGLLVPISVTTGILVHLYLERPLLRRLTKRWVFTPVQGASQPPAGLTADRRL